MRGTHGITCRRPAISDCELILLHRRTPRSQSQKQVSQTTSSLTFSAPSVLSCSKSHNQNGLRMLQLFHLRSAQQKTAVPEILGNRGQLATRFCKRTRGRSALFRARGKAGPSPSSPTASFSFRNVGSLAGRLQAAANPQVCSILLLRRGRHKRRPKNAAFSRGKPSLWRSRFRHRQAVTPVDPAC